MWHGARRVPFSSCSPLTCSPRKDACLLKRRLTGFEQGPALFPICRPTLRTAIRPHASKHGAEGAIDGTIDVNLSLDPADTSSTVVGKQGKSTVVIIGAGISGLAAAELLSSVFQRVVLLERDAFKPGPSGTESGTDGTVGATVAGERRGVPHFQQPHMLLRRGQQALEEIFPGATEELVERGASWRRFGDFKWFSYDGYVDFSACDFKVLGASRALFEDVVRQRVLRLGNVTLQHSTPAKDLMFDDEKRNVVGVAVKDGTLYEADLVVDASGRSSCMPQCIARAGYEQCEAQTVCASVGYASRVWRNVDPHTSPTFISQTPPGKRAASLIPIEGDAWHCAVMGYAGDFPEDDEPTITSFLASLPASDIVDALRDATPASEIRMFRGTNNLLYRYDNMELPGGICVLGDAVVSLDPLYAQGLTVALCSAQLLHQSVRSMVSDASPVDFAAALAGITKPFQKKLKQFVDVPWLIATTEDHERMEEYAQSMQDRLLCSYIKRLTRAAQHDRTAASHLADVIHLMSPPRSLLHPDVVTRVLHHHFLSKTAP